MLVSHDKNGAYSGQSEGKKILILISQVFDSHSFPNINGLHPYLLAFVSISLPQFVEYQSFTLQSVRALISLAG